MERKILVSDASMQWFAEISNVCCSLLLLSLRLYCFGWYSYFESRKELERTKWKLSGKNSDLEAFQSETLPGR